MISFEINNGMTLNLNQPEFDKAVEVIRCKNGNVIESTEKIYPGDFVMLLNLYRYIKENDIQNDFINPYGKNKEEA